MTKNQKLLPCPFCGATPAVATIEPHSHKGGIAGFMPDHPGSAYIDCTCGVGLIDASEEVVVQRWNTRAVSAQAQPAREQIAKIFAIIWHGDAAEWPGFLSKADAFLNFPWDALTGAPCPSEAAPKAQMPVAPSADETADEWSKRWQAAKTRTAQEPVAWRDVIGFENLYQVSSGGDVRSVASGRVLAKCLAGDGYVKAELWRKGKRKQTYVHRLVAVAFLGEAPEERPEINHKDGDKLNNSAANLEWVSRSENVKHSMYALGALVKPIIGTDVLDGSEERFPSIEEAGRSGYQVTALYRCLKGLIPNHRGKTWRFADDVAAPRPALAVGREEIARTICNSLGYIKLHDMRPDSQERFRKAADATLSLLQAPEAKVDRPAIIEECAKAAEGTGAAMFSDAEVSAVDALRSDIASSIRALSLSGEQGDGK